MSAEVEIKKLCAVSFTARGDAIAVRVCEAMRTQGEGRWTHTVCTMMSCHGPHKPNLADWTREAFLQADALVFVGAIGIAVRAIAPLVSSKFADPAVIVIDEGGRWVVPILSGHVGGANDLARVLAAELGLEAIITTASDGRGLWSVDEWAANNNLVIADPERAKTIATRLLAGETITVACDEKPQGRVPNHVRVEVIAHESSSAMIDIIPDVVVSPRLTRYDQDALKLVPRCIALGIGCRRDIPADTIERAISMTLQDAHLHKEAVAQVATIDLKAHEPGLLEFCHRHAWTLATYSANELSRVEGSVSSSAFVNSVTGVDNVCERAALAGGGKLIVPKTVLDGVTVAVVLRAWSVTF